jgi:hypothetical protein
MKPGRTGMPVSTCGGEPYDSELDEAAAVLEAAAPIIAAAEQERIRQLAEAAKFTLYRPGNGPAQGQTIDVVPLDALVAEVTA